MHAALFLNDELAHAERQLTRVRRIAAQLEQQLLDQGLSESDAYAKLADSKAYRQLHHDEIVFQQMWLRTHRHLARLPQPPSTETTTPIPASIRPASGVSRGAHSPTNHTVETIEQILQDLERGQHKPQPIRKPPTPSPNQPCHCGSSIKYKKCCGNPFRQHARAA